MAFKVEAQFLFNVLDERRDRDQALFWNLRLYYKRFNL
jgi:hypothetical protein